jgi:hypothetical protein
MYNRHKHTHTHTLHFTYVCKLQASFMHIKNYNLLSSDLFPFTLNIYTHCMLQVQREAFFLQKYFTEVLKVRN